MTILLPRFQGKAIEVDGEWTWEMLVTFIGDGDEGNVYATEDRFKSKQEAIDNLKEAIQSAMNAISPALKNDTDYYIDMKTNKTRRWDKKDEQ